MSKTAVRKPHPQSREAKLIAAITQYDATHARFIDLAADSAEFVGDPEHSEKLDAAQIELDDASDALWVLMESGSLPVVYGRHIYVCKPSGKIKRAEVQVIG